MSYPCLTNIDTLLLDMDGTLLDLRFDNHFWVEHLPLRYGDIHGLSPDAAMSHVESALTAAEGTMDWYSVHHWSAHFNVDIMTLKNEVRHLVKYREGSRQFLEQMARVDHLNVYIVTDAHPEVLELKHAITGLLDHVHAAYCSHDYGAPKRHAAFWENFAADASFDPRTTLMIDDSPHVLDQSRNAGIAHQLCVEHPDSGRPRDHDHDFPLINNLSDLTRELAQ